MNVAQVVTRFASRARRTGKEGRSAHSGTVDLIYLALLATQAIEEMWLDPKLRPRVELAKRAFRVMPTTFVHTNALRAARKLRGNVSESVRAQMNFVPSALNEGLANPKKRGRRFSNDELNTALRRFRTWVISGNGLVATDVFRPPLRDERRRGGARSITELTVRSGKVVAVETEIEHVADDKLRRAFAGDRLSHNRRLISSAGSDYKAWAKEFERFLKKYAPYEVLSPFGYFHLVARRKLKARIDSALRREAGHYIKDSEDSLWTAFRQVVEARFRRLLK